MGGRRHIHRRRSTSLGQSFPIMVGNENVVGSSRNLKSGRIVDRASVECQVSSDECRVTGEGEVRVRVGACLPMTSDAQDSCKRSVEVESRGKCRNRHKEVDVPSRRLED